jgi:hypothetical protein
LTWQRGGYESGSMGIIAIAMLWRRYLVNVAIW